MKQTIFFLLLVALLGFGATSCKKNTEIADGNPPEVKLILDTLKPDLNVADNIPLVCVVFSEVGLKSVKLQLVRTMGTEDYKEYTQFTDPHQYSVKELPLWAEDFVAFTIIVTDKADQTVQKTIPVSAVPFQAPPVILFDMEEIVIDENMPGAEVPVTKFTVNSAGVLTKLTVKLFVEGGAAINIPLPAPLEEGTNSYEFEEFIPYKGGDVGLQVTATDEYNKVKIETLPIRYIALPPPAIKFSADSNFSTDVGGVANVRLAVTSVAGVASITVHQMKQNTEVGVLPPVLYNGENDVQFSQDVLLEDNVSSLRVVVSDNRGREATVDMRTEVGFEVREITLGSDFYNRGIIEEPDILPFYSIGLNRSMTIGEAYQNIKDVELYILWYPASAYGGDRGLRLMGAKNTTSLSPSESYYHGGTYSWQGKSYTFPSMVPASNWPNRNQSTFIKIGATTNSATIAPFNYDNVTIHDLSNYKTAIKGDRMPFVVEGDMFLIQLDPEASNVGFVGETTGVTSKICIAKILKIEDETRSLDFFTNPWPTAPNIKKIAKVTIGIKIPK